MTHFFSSAAHSLINNIFRMKQKNVIASRSESVVIINSFFECLKYAVMKQSANVVLCEKLARHQLLPLLEWCLIENQAHCKAVCHQTAALVQYWCRNQNEIENYALYLRHFWNGTESLFEGVLMNVETKSDLSTISDVAARQVELLQSLKHPVKLKKQQKVKFTVENQEETLDTEEKEAPLGCGADYFHSLNKLVLKTCEAYIRLIDRKRTKVLIEQLYNIFSSFCDTGIFSYLRGQFGGNEEAKLSAVYWNILHKWLKCSYLCCKPVVDLVFLLMKSLDDEEERSAVLESLKEVAVFHSDVVRY